MLQHPNNKPGKAIVLVGPPGCGKSLFAALLTLLLGGSNVVRVQGRMLIRSTRASEGAFHQGCPLVHLEDCDIRNELPFIIGLLLSPVRAVSRSPFEDPEPVSSYDRVLATTNSVSPLLAHSIEFQQRVLLVPCDVANAQDFHVEMHDPVKMAAFRQYLMRREVAPELW
jgi:ABC-type cobalamin/Fe3+-siderophores transport system ATPase subunit